MAPVTCRKLPTLGPFHLRKGSIQLDWKRYIGWTYLPILTSEPQPAPCSKNLQSVDPPAWDPTECQNRPRPFLTGPWSPLVMPYGTPSRSGQPGRTKRNTDGTVCWRCSSEVLARVGDHPWECNSHFKSTKLSGDVEVECMDLGTTGRSRSGPIHYHSHLPTGDFVPPGLLTLLQGSRFPTGACFCQGDTVSWAKLNETPPWAPLYNGYYFYAWINLPSLSFLLCLVFITI